VRKLADKQCCGMLISVELIGGKLIGIVGGEVRLAEDGDTS
jgi:hypothetical protein